MGATKSIELSREGYTATRMLAAALPMGVWTLELEIERQRELSAAELAVLKLLEVGVCDVQGLASAMGMGSDERLVERTLVKLLNGGAAEARGPGFVPTNTGLRWVSDKFKDSRERVMVELRLDPVLDEFEWVDYEPSVFATKQTWTIELPRTSDEAVLRRKGDIGDLLTRDGLPDDEDRAAGERRGSINLRAVAVLSMRMHWREVEVEVMEHPQRRDPRLIGYIGGAENPPLTQLLEGRILFPKRRRIR